MSIVPFLTVIWRLFDGYFYSEGHGLITLSYYGHNIAILGHYIAILGHNIAILGHNIAILGHYIAILGPSCPRSTVRREVRMS